MKRLAYLTIAAVFALTACSTADPEETVSEFCDAREGLTTAVTELSTLSLSSTASEVDQVRDDIENAWETFEVDTEGLEDSLASQADSAYTDYLNAVSVIPGDAPIGERVQQNVAAAQVFLDEIQQIADSVSCE